MYDKSSVAKISDIANGIKKLRQRNCESQEHLARAIKVDRSLISLMESGKILPSFKTAIKMANHFFMWEMGKKKFMNACIREMIKRYTHGKCCKWITLK